MTESHENGRRMTGLLLVAGLLATLPLAFALAQEDPDATESRTIRKRGNLVSVFSGDLHVPADTQQHGTVVCIGGHVEIEGEVRDEVVVVFGSVNVTGEVGGAVTGVLSRVSVDQAEIGDGLYSILSPLEMLRSVIHGDLVNILGPADIDDASTVLGQEVNISLGSWFPSLGTPILVLRLFLMLCVFVLILFLVALMPERVRVISEEAPTRYVAAFFVGLVGYLGLLIVVGLLAATVIGIPVALLGFFVLQWLGIAGIFCAVGQRLGRAFGREMSVLGSVLLTFALYLLFLIAPSFLGLVGFLLLLSLWTLFFLLVKVPAVGLVILTRAGTRGRATPPPGFPLTRPTESVAGVGSVGGSGTYPPVPVPPRAPEVPRKPPGNDPEDPQR